MNATIKNILKEHDLRYTSCREEVLDKFLQQDFALSHADLEANVSEHFDRVTVYRTLRTFLDAGLIHKVLDDEGITKYALCRQHCSLHEHHHEHVHFKCTSCGLTNCLDNVQIPSIILPNGYRATETNLLMQGVCANCSERK